MLGKAVEAMTFGIVHEVDEAENHAPIIEGHTTVEGAHASPESLPLQSRNETVSPATASDIATAAAARASKDLNSILGATSTKFQQFLLKKQEFADVLREGGAAEDRIETVATAKAIKAIKLTIADVNDAASAAQNAIGALKADFNAFFQEAHRTKVEQPTSDISATETKIQGIRDSITAMEKQIADLQSGIAPAHTAITNAQTNLDKGKAIFDSSCAQVDARLKAMESAILAAMQQKV